MTGLISALSWVIENWQTIATAFSSIASIALFFMHGNARSELQDLRNFINSVQLSQSPMDAQAQMRNQNPKV